MTVLKITIAALILSFSMSTAVTAQDSLWTRTYGGDWWDGANAIDATRDGGFIVAGFNSSTPGTYDRKFYLLKIDAAGDTLWTKIFGTQTKNIASSVRETADDGFIMVGRTESSPYVNDVHLIRTDQDGNILWDRTYDWYSDDRGHDVWQTSDGGFIVAGQTYVPTVPFGSYDMLLMRTDASGNMLWWQTYAFDPDTGGDYALAVQETDDGDFIVGGGTQSTVWDAILLRTDALGNLIWMKNYGLIQGQVNDVRQTADGGFILTGHADSDVLLMKTDADGNSLWTRGFGGDSTDRGDSVKELSGGGYIVTGMTSGPSPPNAELYVIRTDANGDSLWTGVFGGTGDDRGHSVVQAHDGNILVAGTTWSFGAGRGDVWLIKIADEPGSLGTPYCSALPSSTGLPASISASGSPSVTDNDLTLFASPVPDDWGLFFFSPGQQQTPFGNGFLCVTQPIVRILPPAPASGEIASRVVDLPSFGFTAGTHDFQYWFRDPAGGGALFNLSNALEVVFVP